METPAEQLVAAARDFERAGRREQAEAAWKRAAEGEVVSPVDPGARLSIQHYYKALALDQVGRKDAAAALYTRLAGADQDELAPRGAAKYMLMGLGLDALGRAGDAADAFKHCRALDAHNPNCQPRGHP
jgi:tetratricopeptide (TPR) repeat protein